MDAVETFTAKHIKVETSAVNAPGLFHVRNMLVRIELF